MKHPGWNYSEIILMALRAVEMTGVVTETSLGGLLVEGPVATSTSELLLSQTLLWADLQAVLGLILREEKNTQSRTVKKKQKPKL